MRLIRNFITIFALLLVFACIKPYNPVIESNAANKLVVSGRVTDVESNLRRHFRSEAAGQ